MDSYGFRGGYMVEGGFMCFVEGYIYNLISKYIGLVDFFFYLINS